MSHRRECPDPYEARRQGERDFEYGYHSNPYGRAEPDESYEDRRCRERADDEYRSGYRHAEYLAEEEAAERRAHERAEANRREEQALEDARYEYESQQHEQPTEPGEEQA